MSLTSWEAHITRNELLSKGPIMKSEQRQIIFLLRPQDATSGWKPVVWKVLNSDRVEATLKSDVMFAVAAVRVEKDNGRINIMSYCVVPPGQCTSYEAQGKPYGTWSAAQSCENNYNSIKAVNETKMRPMIAICTCSSSERDGDFEPKLKPIMVYEQIQQDSSIQIKCLFKLEAFAVDWHDTPYKEAQIIDISRLERTRRLRPAVLGDTKKPWSLDLHKEPLSSWDVLMRLDGLAVMSRGAPDQKGAPTDYSPGPIGYLDLAMPDEAADVRQQLIARNQELRVTLNEMKKENEDLRNQVDEMSQLRRQIEELRLQLRQERVHNGKSQRQLGPPRHLPVPPPLQSRALSYESGIRNAHYVERGVGNVREFPDPPAQQKNPNLAKTSHILEGRSYQLESPQTRRFPPDATSTSISRDDDGLFSQFTNIFFSYWKGDEHEGNRQMVSGAGNRHEGRASWYEDNSREEIKIPQGVGGNGAGLALQLGEYSAPRVRTPFWGENEVNTHEVHGMRGFHNGPMDDSLPGTYPSRQYRRDTVV